MLRERCAVVAPVAPGVCSPPVCLVSAFSFVLVVLLCAAAAAAFRDCGERENEGQRWQPNGAGGMGSQEARPNDRIPQQGSPEGQCGRSAQKLSCLALTTNIKLVCLTKTIKFVGTKIAWKFGGNNLTPNTAI